MYTIYDMGPPGVGSREILLDIPLRDLLCCLPVGLVGLDDALVPVACKTRIKTLAHLKKFDSLYNHLVTTVDAEHLKQIV